MASFNGNLYEMQMPSLPSALEAKVPSGYSKVITVNYGR